MWSLVSDLYIATDLSNLPQYWEDFKRDCANGSHNYYKRLAVIFCLPRRAFLINTDKFINYNGTSLDKKC